ncbi:hypothetical protein NQZ79_g7639 [Umbelopsis isabellina]|nr:hypothetical protein NQZ79_g7639 [Umbelopsis isabellina]
MTDTLETELNSATHDSIESGIESVTRSFLRKEVKHDSKHNPQVLSLIDQDIKALKEEENRLIEQLLQANKSLLEQYKKVIVALSNSETGGKLKQDIERAVIKKIQDELDTMFKSVSKEIEQTLDAQTSQSLRELDNLKADSTKLETRINRHIDDCTKNFDSISSDMRKSRRSTSPSSESLYMDRRLMKDLKEYHNYLKRIDTEGKGIASNNSLDIIHTRFKRLQEDTAEQIELLNRRNEDLQRKSVQLENFTRDYNRRSSEIDIVYDRIKTQMDTLKKESENIQARASKTKDTQKEITDIRAQLAELKAEVSRKVTENDSRSGIDPGSSNSNGTTDLKALQIIESRIILLEQSYTFRLKEVEDTIKDFSQTHKDGEKNNNGKRPRTDDSERGSSELKLQMDKQAVQIKELMAFLEPLRSTVLGNTFAQNLQTSMDQLISVARRHESDIDHIYTALKQAAHSLPMENPNHVTPELESTLEAQVNTHERRMKEKHTLIMEKLEDFKSSFIKSEEKQQKQQIEIDKLQQQLIKTTSLLQTLQNACSQSGILPEKMGD